jgi:hypothetical protein
MSVAGVETRDLGHPEAAWVSTQRYDRIARFDLSLASHSEIEAEEATLEKPGDEVVASHPDAELEAAVG